MTLRTITFDDERSPADYAIEHAEYLAKAAERFIEAVDAASVADHEHEGTAEDEARVDAASEAVGEAQGALRNCIYEFRKRRDRAAAPEPPAPQPITDDADPDAIVAPLPVPEVGEERQAMIDQLRDQAIELDMLREALGVPYEPHQSLLERMLEAARGRAGSGAAPEPPAQEPEPAAYMYQHDETGRTTFREADDRMNERRWEEFPLYRHPASEQQPMTDAEIACLMPQWIDVSRAGWLKLVCLRMTRAVERHHGIGKGESDD